MARHWYFILGGAAFALVGVVMLVNLVITGFSPASYVAKTYAAAPAAASRADSRSFTGAVPPSVVAAKLVDKWRPVSQYADGSGVYLRYSDDAIVIHPRGRGSLIKVMDIDRAYRTYYGHVGGGWGWTSTHGESFRGRGPGAGK